MGSPPLFNTQALCVKQIRSSLDNRDVLLAIRPGHSKDQFERCLEIVDFPRQMTCQLFFDFEVSNYPLLSNLLDRV